MPPKSNNGKKKIEPISNVVHLPQATPRVTPDMLRGACTPTPPVVDPLSPEVMVPLPKLVVGPQSPPRRPISINKQLVANSLKYHTTENGAPFPDTGVTTHSLGTANTTTTLTAGLNAPAKRSPRAGVMASPPVLAPIEMYPSSAYRSTPPASDVGTALDSIRGASESGSSKYRSQCNEKYVLHGRHTPAHTPTAEASLSDAVSSASTQQPQVWSPTRLSSPQSSATSATNAVPSSLPGSQSPRRDSLSLEVSPDQPTSIVAPSLSMRAFNTVSPAFRLTSFRSRRQVSAPEGSQVWAQTLRSPHRSSLFLTPTSPNMTLDTTQSMLPDTSPDKGGSSAWPGRSPRIVGAGPQSAREVSAAADRRASSTVAVSVLTSSANNNAVLTPMTTDLSPSGSALAGTAPDCILTAPLTDTTTLMETLGTAMSEEPENNNKHTKGGSPAKLKPSVESSSNSNNGQLMNSLQTQVDSKTLLNSKSCTSQSVRQQLFGWLTFHSLTSPTREAVSFGLINSGKSPNEAGAAQLLDTSSSTCVNKLLPHMAVPQNLATFAGVQSAMQSQDLASRSKKGGAYGHPLAKDARNKGEGELHSSTSSGFTGEAIYRRQRSQHGGTKASGSLSPQYVAATNANSSLCSQRLIPSSQCKSNDTNSSFNFRFNSTNNDNDSSNSNTASNNNNNNNNVPASSNSPRSHASPQYPPLISLNSTASRHRGTESAQSILLGERRSSNLSVSMYGSPVACFDYGADFASASAHNPNTNANSGNYTRSTDGGGLVMFAARASLADDRSILRRPSILGSVTPAEVTFPGATDGAGGGGATAAEDMVMQIVNAGGFARPQQFNASMSALSQGPSKLRGIALATPSDFCPALTQSQRRIAEVTIVSPEQSQVKDSVVMSPSALRRQLVGNNTTGSGSNVSFVPSLAANSLAAVQELPMYVPTRNTAPGHSYSLHSGRPSYGDMEDTFEISTHSNSIISFGMGLNTSSSRRVLSHSTSDCRDSATKLARLTVQASAAPDLYTIAVPGNDFSNSKDPTDSLVQVETLLSQGDEHAFGQSSVAGGGWRNRRHKNSRRRLKVNSAENSAELIPSVGADLIPSTGAELLSGSGAPQWLCTAFIESDKQSFLLEGSPPPAGTEMPSDGTNCSHNEKAEGENSGPLQGLQPHPPGSSGGGQGSKKPSFRLAFWRRKAPPGQHPPPTTGENANAPLPSDKSSAHGHTNRLHSEEVMQPKSTDHSHSLTIAPFVPLDGEKA